MRLLFQIPLNGIHLILQGTFSKRFRENAIQCTHAMALIEFGYRGDMQMVLSNSSKNRKIQGGTGGVQTHAQSSIPPHVHHLLHSVTSSQKVGNSVQVIFGVEINRTKMHRLANTEGFTPISSLKKKNLFQGHSTHSRIFTYPRGVSERNPCVKKGITVVVVIVVADQHQVLLQQWYSYAFFYAWFTFRDS